MLFVGWLRDVRCVLFVVCSLLACCVVCVVCSLVACCVLLFLFVGVLFGV